MAIYWLFGRFMPGSEVVPGSVGVGCCWVGGMKWADNARLVACWRIQFPTADSPGKLPCPAASGERLKSVYPSTTRMMPQIRKKRRRGFILRCLPVSAFLALSRFFLLPGMTTIRPVLLVVMVDWSAESSERVSNSGCVFLAG